jgi:hypothetical protein
MKFVIDVQAGKAHRSMILIDRSRQSPDDMARELLQEAEILRRHAEDIAALRARIAAYERQFGLPSSKIHAAINAGSLQETREVCDWIMDYELLERVQSQFAG